MREKIKFAVLHQLHTCRTSSVTVNGITLKKESVVITNRLNEETDYPDFGTIKELLIATGKRVFLGLHKLVVQEYSDHHKAYVVRQTEEKYVQQFNTLPTFQVLHLIPVPLTHCTLKYIIPKYTI